MVMKEALWETSVSKVCFYMKSCTVSSYLPDDKTRCVRKFSLDWSAGPARGSQYSVLCSKPSSFKILRFSMWSVSFFLWLKKAKYFSMCITAENMF